MFSPGDIVRPKNKWLARFTEYTWGTLFEIIKHDKFYTDVVQVQILLPEKSNGMLAFFDSDYFELNDNV